MKKFMTPEVALINLDANDILCTSLTVGVDPSQHSSTMQTPAREGVFSAPAEQQNAGNGIW